MDTTCATAIPATQNEQSQNWFSRLGDSLATVYVAMHFLPIATSIGWILYCVFGQSDSLLYALFPILLLGWASALLTHPIRILWAVIKRTGGALLAGLMIPIFPANLVLALVFGGVILAGFLLALVFAPAIFTLYYFFEET